MRQRWFRIVLGTAIGAIIGYAYYYLIGCRTGTCPLTGNPIITTLYGSVAGAVLAAPKK